MNSEQKQTAPIDGEAMTPNEILAQGWRLTRAILALRGLEVPDIIEFQIDGAMHIRATRVAPVKELAKAITALDEAIQRPSSREHLQVEPLSKQRDALVELLKRASTGGCPRTPQEREELERWLTIRKGEALKIDPQTAEVDWSYAQTLDPYDVLDEWELPEEFHQVGREYFARAPGSDIWVEFGDLSHEIRDKLWQRHRRNLAFPAGLEGLLDMGVLDKP
jgi:hypothetical protein